MSNINGTLEIPASEHTPAGKVGFFSADISMVILTWVTFFILLAVLYKFAWKPILAGLDNREDTIRRSLKEADLAHQEYERLDQTRAQRMAEIDEEANALLNQSRKTAANAAKVMEERAKEKAEIILENTQRELLAQKEKAEAQLRQESADLAVSLASKIMSENLDYNKNRDLIDKFIEEI